MNDRYRLEFILNTYNSTLEAVKNALVEFSEDLQVDLAGAQAQSRNSFKITMIAEDPTVIFDICSQYGKIKSVKIKDKEEIV